MSDMKKMLEIATKQLRAEGLRDKDGSFVIAPTEPAGPLGALGVATGSKNKPRVSEDGELRAAASVAEEACREEQPMPSGGMNQTLIADCCEIIAERHAKEKLWRSTAVALRMACWYYRKACAE